MARSARASPTASTCSGITSKPCRTVSPGTPGFWHHAIFSGYDFRHDQHPALGYIVSALVGMAVVAIAILGVFAVLRRLRVRLATGRVASVKAGA